MRRVSDASPAAGIAGSATLSRAFEYDALYRLLQATGRESGSFASSARPWNEGYYVPDASVSNTRGYRQNYEYDRLGNMLHLHHQASGNTFHRYLNDFSNNAAAFELSNLATEISYGGTTVNYAFDACGNQVSEGTSRHMGWDYGDRMRTYATQVGTSEPTVYAHYLYDAGGNRVKKIVRKSAGNTEVTIYIDGGMEYLYEFDGSTKVQEMNELHVMDGRSRIARVREVLLSSWTGAAPVGVLYNVEDHLGNACFSLTAMGGDYSREEYFPFGETSFRDFGKERYRFCGKERDEESGLYYYGARYYAAWGCRFVSVDPLAGEYPFYTPYQYAGNKPVNFIDLDGLEPGGGGGSVTKSACEPSCDSPNRIERTITMEILSIDEESITGRITTSQITFENGVPTDSRSNTTTSIIPTDSPDGNSFLNSFLELTGNQSGKGSVVGFYNSMVREGPYNTELSRIKERYPAITKNEFFWTPESVVEKIARDANGARNDARVTMQEKLTPSGLELSKAVESDRSFEKMMEDKLPQNGGDRKATMNSIIKSASKSNKWVNRFSKFGKYGGAIGTAYGAYSTYKRIHDAANGISNEPLGEVVKEEVFSWSGAIAGAEIGTAIGVAIGVWAGPGMPIVAMFCGFLGGLAGGFFGGALGQYISNPSNIRYTGFGWHPGLKY